jgi:hypothetical protein
VSTLPWFRRLGAWWVRTSGPDRLLWVVLGLMWGVAWLAHHPVGRVTCVQGVLEYPMPIRVGEFGVAVETVDGWWLLDLSEVPEFGQSLVLDPTLKGHAVVAVGGAHRDHREGLVGRVLVVREIRVSGR